MTRMHHTIANLLATFIMMSAPLRAQETFNWARFHSLWNAYVDHPTPKRAEVLTRMLPAHVESSNTKEEGSARDALARGLDVLQRRVIASDTSAVRLAYSLLSLSDGDTAESLFLILGDLIVHNPTLFLDELLAHKHLILSDERDLLGSLLHNEESSYNAIRKEAEARVNALERVARTDLQAIRDTCVQSLRSEIDSQVQADVWRFDDLLRCTPSSFVDSLLGPPYAEHSGSLKWVFDTGEVWVDLDTSCVTRVYWRPPNDAQPHEVRVVTFLTWTQTVARTSSQQITSPPVFRVVR
jgi:hypothetical protein